METAHSYTKRILGKYSIRAKKSLGQNFLIDDNVVQNIISGSGLKPGEEVLEVGPGPGVLTKALADVASRVWALELDDNLSAILTEEFKSKENVTIIHTDALKFELGNLQLNRDTKVKLIANLPYYITSPLINHFLEQRQYLTSMTIMVQQEVAQRIAAKPGTKEYGVLSVAIQAFCKAQILFNVPPGSFLPQPKVHSAVVRLDILDVPKINLTMEKEFFKVVKAAFAQRRKTLLNSLSQGISKSKDEISAIIEQVGLSPNVRAENLSIDDFCRLTDSLFSGKVKQ